MQGQKFHHLTEGVWLIVLQRLSHVAADLTEMLLRTAMVITDLQQH